MQQFGLVALLFLAAVSCAFGNSLGPPISVCTSLTPGHSSQLVTSNNGGYIITTDIPINDDNTGYQYAAGQTYTVTLQGMIDPFRGFAIQSRSVPANTPVGNFVPQNSNQQILNCDPNVDFTIVHRNPSPRTDFNSQQFMWTAPSSPGTVDFRYTVVRSNPGNFYVGRSAVTEFLASSQTPEVTTQQTQAPEATTQKLQAPEVTTQEAPMPTEIPPGVDTPTRAPEDYDLILREPDGCMVSNCNTFVGINVNSGDSDYLDIYMEGAAMGWVAVGFTQIPNMFEADVVACNRVQEDDSIEVLDTWNPNSRANEVDVVQDAYMFMSNFENGRISCTIGRSIAGTGTNQDFNLNGEYHVLYGRNLNAPAAGSLTTHFGGGPNPSISQMTRIVGLLQAPTTSPADYPLVFKSPSDCDVSDCTVYVGIERNEGNSDYLNFYIEGDATAWVAVGFSTTPNMFSADVLACNRVDGGEEVEVLDTWNLAASRGNVVDDVQDTLVFSSSVEDGRIVCSFGRSIAGTGGQDVDLDGEYYVLYGRSDGSTSSGSLITHLSANPPSNPSVSGEQYNIVSGATPPEPAAPTGLPEGVTEPSISPADYPLVFKSPSDCDVSDCTVYVGIQGNEGNSDYLNFYIEGDAAAWVAVGFSTSNNMPNADVLACNRVDGTEEVEVLDAWNPSNPIYTNVVDDVQDTFMFSSSVEDGRISCSFGRSIAGTGDDQDVNLGGQYYVLFGGSDGMTSSGFLLSHRSANPPTSPFVTGAQFNISADAGVGTEGTFASVRRALIRAHGIFMLIAWLLLVNIGTHFAWYMRPVLPNGEWFQVHRAVMVIALFISAAGFIFAFVSQAERSPPGLLDFSNGTKRAHLIIGVLVVFFQILNPIIAIFRCHPGEKYRWVFNVFHGKIFGQWAPLLGITNVGLGLSIFSVDYSRFGNLTLLWIFLAYVGLSLLMHLVLIILSIMIGRKCKNSAKCSGKAEGGVGMKKVDGYEKVTIPEKEKSGDKEEEKKERKEPPEGSIYIWMAMGSAIAIFTAFSLVFLVLVALPM